MKNVITENTITKFESHLRSEEKSENTIEKYLRDVRAFFAFLGGRAVSKEITVAYKETLKSCYAPASVNSMLIAVNGFLRFAGYSDCTVKTLKVQRQIFCEEEKELTRDEYRHLLKAADGTRLYYVMRTICGVGIRVSELKYITAEAVQSGKAVVTCKGKTRVILIPGKLRKELLAYMKKAGIKAGCVFITRNGKPLNRSNIWRDMKALCDRAGVARQKVFPHNLRHLFARLFYSVEKDIVRLADILGHSNINTTRIYTVETGKQHMIGLDRVQTVLIT